jgi:hypothetical protein
MDQLKNSKASDMTYPYVAVVVGIGYLIVNGIKSMNKNLN